MASITLTVSNEIAAVMLPAILREHPILDIPVLDEEGNPTYKEDGSPITEPECTPIQQVKRLAMAYLTRETIAGAKKLRLDNDPIDMALIQSVINDNLS